MAIKVWEVGGSIRDELLGLESDDIDAAVECGSFAELINWVEKTHKEVFLTKPEHFTVRAIDYEGTVRDYVMCRKESAYTDGRRPDSVEPGTIYDDLARRDFTVNAIAKNPDTGELLDPHGGIVDIKFRTLRCVGDPLERLSEDGLRILRAIRFAVTKRLQIEDQAWKIIRSQAAANMLRGVSPDRIVKELTKCFKHDVALTIEYLNYLHPVTQVRIFNDSGIWLLPTTKKR
jgi:tRNA nucleotidyltransferase (CCA-adding enzyme)